MLISLSQLTRLPLEALILVLRQKLASLERMLGHKFKTVVELLISVL